MYNIDSFASRNLGMTNEKIIQFSNKPWNPGGLFSGLFECIEAALFLQMDSCFSYFSNYVCEICSPVGIWFSACMTTVEARTGESSFFSESDVFLQKYPRAARALIMYSEL